MNTTTSLIAAIASICVVAFGIAALAASFYGIVVWYPRYRQRKVNALKTEGR